MPVLVSTTLSSVEKTPVSSVALRTRSSALTGSGSPLASCGLDVGHAVLRHRELHVDRVHLRDHRDAGGRVGRHVVARVDRAQADAAGHRRGDAGVVEVELGGRLGGAVGDHGAFELLDQRGLRVDVLARDRVLASAACGSAPA